MYSKETVGEIMETINRLSKTLVSYCNDRAQLSEVEAFLLIADNECSSELVEKANDLTNLVESNIDLYEKLIELYCETLLILSKRN